MMGTNSIVVVSAIRGRERQQNWNCPGGLAEEA